MTKQILLKTPRGNTAVIPVDHFVAKARASAVMTRCRGSCSSSCSSFEPTLALSSGEEENTVSFSYHSTTRETPLFSLEEDSDAAAIASAVDTSRIFENHNPNENGNGNDVVDVNVNVNVDDHHCCDPDRQSKEELLFHLIGASKRRDVGRKRNLRSVYNLEVEGEDEDDGMEVDTGIGIGTETDSGMEIDGDSSDDQSSHSLSGSRSGADDPEQKAVAHRFDEMTIHRDRHCRSSSSSSNRFKSRRKFYSHSSARSATAFGAAEATSTSTSTSTSAATCTSTCASASTCASTSTSTSTTTRRRQRYEPTLSRQCHDQQPPPPQGRLSGTAMVNDAPAPACVSASSRRPLMVAFYHQGRIVSLDRIWDWITQSPASTNPVSDTANASSSSSSSPSATNRTITEQSSSTAPQFPLYLTLSTSVRLLGGIDRQNRVGSKFGGGGVSSSQNAERERKERLKQLALESIDLAKDPYLMRNHLGTYECKLCLTLHTNEANYLAHTQGKKHQSGLAKRAHMEKVRKEREEQLADRNQLKRPPPGGRFVCPPATKVPKIGRPAYQVFKSKDPETSQRCLTFELTYKDIRKDLQPRHRFMSAFEQRVDLPRDKRYQYVLFAAEPYETIAFKIPNEPLDRDPGRLITHWDEDDKKFTVTLYFEDGTNGGNENENESGSGSGKEETKEEGDAVVGMDTDGGTGTASAFAPALLGGR